MKLPAFLILLSVSGAYSSPGTQNSGNASPASLDRKASAQTSTPESRDVPLTPRQVAEMRADLLNARKDYLAAAQAYEEILKAEPRNVDLLDKTGVAYQAMGQLDTAESYYKKVLKVDRHFSTALNNLGTAEYSQQRYATAIKYYRRALEHNSHPAVVYSNLAYAYSAQHADAKALDAFAKALALDPDLYSHHGGVGTLLQERSAEDSGLVCFLLAKSYAKMGDAEHTVQYLKLAGDGGYKNFAAAAKDMDFAPVIENPRVREALHLPPITRPNSGGGKTPS
jgi:tetratricopeptide (TPR) repeat protein